MSLVYFILILDSDMSSRMNSGCDEVDGSKKFKKKNPQTEPITAALEAENVCTFPSGGKNSLIQSRHSAECYLFR